MKVAIYARVSTREKAECTICGKTVRATDFRLLKHEDKAGTRCAGSGLTVEDTAGQDTENQLRELREFAGSSGWTIATEYIDHESAKSGDRDQFQAMLADASKRKFKGVVVWALDRFTREGIEATFGYVRQLKDSGVDFISYSEPHFRTTGPAGTLMLAVAAWIAEQERKRISDRTKAGMETARLRGKVIGRPVKQIDAARLRELHSAGNGVMKIAKVLSTNGQTVSRETVRRILRRLPQAS